MLRAFVQYTLNVDLNAPVIKDLVEKYKDIEQFNRSITDYGHENEMYNVGVEVKEGECL